MKSFLGGAVINIFFAANMSALAQETLVPIPSKDQPSTTDVDSLDQNSQAEPINEDEMAASLNARQQFQQTYTFTRTIDGKVVETEKRTVTIKPGESVANTSALQALRNRFDSELLTRTEAFEEAKQDFTAADTNNDNFMSADEFAGLANMWRESEARNAAPATKAQKEEQELVALLAEIAPEEVRKETEANARRKFAFMAGVAENLSSKDYIAEYLLDFDTMDANGDTLLNGVELANFRAVTRGQQNTTVEEGANEGFEQEALPAIEQSVD